jgi:small subunit ribosomal protein S9
MAGDTPTPDEAAPDEVPAEEQLAAAEESAAEAVPVETEADAVAADETPTPAAEADAPAEAEAPAADDAAATPAEPVADAAEAADDEGDDEPETPRVKPSIPGADLEVDLVLEGEKKARREDEYGNYIDDDGDESSSDDAEDDLDDQPVAATIDLAAGARYKATGKRKTAVARVILRPGTGAYVINGKTLDEFFPRHTLQRQIRQPLEAVGYEERMDVIARMHGGGVSSQAGALRHGISRALLDADPNLRGELKRRGFLTRDSRVKERKKAGLKKARKRPQFSKR